MSFAIWFTGPSGAGKTTASRLVAAHLLAQGHPVCVLDGDELRQTLCKDLGFSKADRDENIRRIGRLAYQLTQRKVIVCVAVISPYDAIRKEIRKKIGRFVLVYCHAPLEILETRDVKGLYAKVRRGEIKGFTGIDAPYEVPCDHELELCSDGTITPDQSAQDIIQFVKGLGYIPHRIPLIEKTDKSISQHRMGGF